MPYEFGPPIVVKPGYELLAEGLLAAGDSAGESAAFHEALERAPGRRLILGCLARTRGAATSVEAR